MKGTFPIFERWFYLFASYVVKNILRRSPLRVLGINDLFTLVKLQYVRVNGVNLLERARFLKDAGIVNTIQQRLTDAPVRYPERECPEGSAD